jgi:hypothetical protein
VQHVLHDTLVVIFARNLHSWTPQIAVRRLGRIIEMLHCKPSQIQLTTADVRELDRRMANRRRASSSDVSKGKARLSTGPRLPTIIAAAHAEDGIAAQHASTSTPYSPTRPGDETTQQSRHAMPSKEASALALRPHLQHSSQLAPTPDAEPVKVDSPRASPSPPRPPRQGPPRLDIAWDTSLRHRRRQTSPSHHAVGRYDGADDSGDVRFLRPQPTTARPAPLHAGREVFRQLPGGEPSVSPPRTSPRRFPGGNTRRATVRSQDGVAHLQADSAAQVLAQDPSPHASRPLHGHNGPSVNSRQDLDPDAPVFTPRVRFGSTTIVPNSESASPEATNTSTLRDRTLSEQNTSPSNERRLQADTPSQETRPRRLRSNVIMSRSRRSSENSALPPPNLDRYPLILPNPRSAFEHERGDSSIPATSVLPTASVSSSSNEHAAETSSAAEASSTPDTRSSRIPSMVSAASGISSLSIANDAAAEFLRFRSSPLDGLTAELSRLSTALGPASKSTQKHVSLLNGNPFDSNNATTHDELPCIELVSETHNSSKDVVSPRLLASPSHFTLASSPPQPSTPIPQPSTPIPQPSASLPEVESQHRHSETRKVNATTSAPAPAPLTATTATPKLPVYNDATPARLQPQTPADITRSSRRTRNRSDSSAHRETFCVGQVLVAPRPVIPERRAYRNTYPTNAPGSSVLPLADDVEIRQHQVAGTNEAENETGGQLAGLESERAVWMRRRQGGSLDVTPPGHGRFERFLH